MKNECIVRGKTLTTLVKWLNGSENVEFHKENNSDFTIGDVQSYIKRGALPTYMGGNKVERDESIKEVKLYNIVK